MTELEWLACTSPSDMLDYLCEHRGASRRKGGSRKLRLLACACCRRVWHMLTAHRDRRVVLLSEDFADGRASEEKLRSARQRCLDLSLHLFLPEVRAAVATAGPLPRAAAKEVMASVCDALSCQAADDDDRWQAEAGKLAEVVREVFGNPFRPVTLPPAHRTPTVVTLARAAYDERILPSGELDPVRLAILADALEECGAVGELVAHLREPGPHVRGCWTLDAVLRLT